MSQLNDDEEEGLPHAEKKGETWLMTFADMMSLLMSFFVLLLSFSEQDSAKFKQVGGSLEKAFGVQTEIPVFDVVKGTSLVSDKFSAGKPEPTDQNEIKQKTTAELTPNLQVNKRPKDNEKNLTTLSEKIKLLDNQESKNNKHQAELQENIKNKEEQHKKAQQILKQLQQELATEITDHKIEIAQKKDSITIRILEKTYFNSGDDSLKPSFIPLLKKISPLLQEFPGKIVISGHTDNIPISNARFRSNWDLSAARAATTLHYLNTITNIKEGKMVITGYADTRPLSDNNSVENRGRNRRVEITLLQGENPLFQDEDEQEIHTEKIPS